jgi:hypothetical protein
MKRLLFIVVIIAICISINANVLAKVKFGNWVRWDEELPPWDNEDWVYSKVKEESATIISIPPIVGMQFWFWTTGEQEQWRSIKVTSPPSVTGNEEIFFVITRLAFKDDDRKIMIVIFSPPPISREVHGVKNALTTAEFAIAVFPSEKWEKVDIRSYEKKDGLLQFFKKWTIVFENKTVLVPKKYKDWFINQSKKLTKEDIGLPQLILLTTNDNKIKKISFIIGVDLPLFKEFLIKEKLPGIKRETTVLF